MIEDGSGSAASDAGSKNAGARDSGQGSSTEAVDRTLRWRLALMPNGEAFRADRVVAVRIVEEMRLVGAERPRFAVVVELTDGSRCTLDGDLARRDAAALARQATREVNDQLLASRAEPLA